MLKNRLEAFSQIPDSDEEVMAEFRSLLKVTESKIAKLEKRMLEITKLHYEQTFRLITDIPAIGPKTAIMLIALTNNFQKFDNAKKLSSYVGLSPRIYQSGTSVNGKGHITKMGNSQMRKLLYLCSWSAKRCNSQCKAMYERMSEKGKPERVIKTAIANKLLRQAFAIGKSLSDYQENYQKTFVF
jgi:transposase